MSERYTSKFDRENGISSIVEAFDSADTTQIFVHDVMSLSNSDVIAAIVQGCRKYCERALVVAGPDDIVFVLDRLDNQFLQFLSNLGIRPKDENIIVASEGVSSHTGAELSDLLLINCKALLKVEKLVGQSNKIILNPFIATQKEFKLAATMEMLLGRKIYTLGGNSRIVDYADGKHNAKKKAAELGVPVAEGDIVKLQLREDGRPIDLARLEIAINKYIERTGRVIVKGSCGISGSSTIIVENNNKSIQEALTKISGKKDNNIYLVEVMSDVIVSPNVLMYLEPDNGRILCVSITDQCLDRNLAHQGNIYPSITKKLKDMIISAHKISKWLHTEGFSGLVGFDFVECLSQEKGKLEHFLADINPRTNGATYPKTLMERLNIIQGQKGRPYIESFLSINVMTEARTYSEFNELYGHIFFNPEVGKGLVPYNTGCLEDGKCTVAVFGESRDEVFGIYKTFKGIS
jgi:hypothetical protein